MVRVKRGKTTIKRRRNVLKQTKGFRWGRKSKERAATEALLHAYTHSFHDRRKKKGEMRKVWNIRINAGARTEGISYSKLIGSLKKANIQLNRKMLAELAEKHPAVFSKVLEQVK